MILVSNRRRIARIITGSKLFKTKIRSYILQEQVRFEIPIGKVSHSKFASQIRVISFILISIEEV